jgi:hypothetical protein
MKHKIIVMYTNSEITLAVEKKDFKETLKDIYFQLSQAKNFSAQRKTDMESNNPSFTFPREYVYELVEIAKTLFEEANKNTDYEAKRNALDFFNACKAIYKVHAKQDYQNSNSTTATKNSGSQNPASSAKTASQSSAIASSKHGVTTSKKDNETSAPKSHSSQDTRTLAASLVFDSDNDKADSEDSDDDSPAQSSFTF